MFADTLRSRGDDDDAFHPLGDLRPLPRSSKLSRPASFAAADARSKKFGNKSKLSSESVSPTRKSSIPSINYDVGKNTLQRKVQKMLKKKVSSKHLFSVPNKTKRNDESLKSSLLKLDETPNSVETEPLVLDQCDVNLEFHGDQNDQLCTSKELTQCPNNNAEHNHTFSSNSQSKTNNVKCSCITDVQAITDRRDSGLSSCSCLTSTPVSSSAPVTPSYQDISTGELQFQYPNVTNSTSQNSSNSRRVVENASEIFKAVSSLYYETFAQPLISNLLLKHR